MAKRWWKKKTVVYEGEKEGIPDVPPVEQHMPVIGKQVRKFTTLQTIHSTDFQCDFVAGKTHTLRTSDSDHENSDAAKLARLTAEWDEEGLIEWLDNG